MEKVEGSTLEKADSSNAFGEANLAIVPFVSENKLDAGYPESNEDS